jgi:hypothetical protein
MFKSKKKKKAFKLSKTEQKEILKNSFEEAAILLATLAIFIMFFSKETELFFKSITSLTNIQRLEVIILFIPICLIIGLLYTVTKVFINRKI